MRKTGPRQHWRHWKNIMSESKIIPLTQSEPFWSLTGRGPFGWHPAEPNVAPNRSYRRHLTQPTTYYLILCHRLSHPPNQEATARQPHPQLPTEQQPQHQVPRKEEKEEPANRNHTYNPQTWMRTMATHPRRTHHKTHMVRNYCSTYKTSTTAPPSD